MEGSGLNIEQPASSRPGANGDSWLPGEAMAMLSRPSAWRLALGGCEATSAAAGGVPEWHRQWSRRHSHRHPYAECLMALDGDCLYGVDGGFQRCRPYTAVYFPPGCLHDDHYPREVRSVRHLWLRFLDDGVIVALFERNRTGSGNSGTGRDFLDRTQLGLEPMAFVAGDGRWPVAVRGEFKRLLIGAVGLKLVEKLSRSEGEGSAAPCLQQQVVDSIRQHIASTGGCGLTLEGLARLSGYSKFHFHRLFRGHAGMTVQQAIDQARRTYCRRRRQEGARQQEIAAELGFSSAASFSRWWKAGAGHSGDG